jgi:hypothetical protein
MYLAYDTPHAKLQLPPCAYPSGTGLKGGVQWLGTPGRMINTAAGVPDSYVHPDYAMATWDHDRDPSTPEQPWPDVYKRFATDVRRIDDCVADILGLLTDLKIDRDTLVIFTSDNGPSQESYLKEPYEADFFNSFGPFDGIKRDCWEGGIRVGAIARWPGVIPARRVSDVPCMAHDWMPTFAQIAGVPAPARSDGVSLMPALTGKGRQQPSRVYVEYFVQGKTPSYGDFLPAHRGRPRRQMQAIRLGDYVGVRYDVKSHTDPFEIYNIVTDPQQANDLGSSPHCAALQKEMHDTVLRVRRPDASAPRPYDRELVPALAIKSLAPGVEWRLFRGPTPWVANLDALRPNSAGIQPGIDVPPAPARGDYSLVIAGCLEAPEDGEYTFKVTCDGGALLRIHEATVIDIDPFFAQRANTGSIRLQKGVHPFRLHCRCAGPEAQNLAIQWHWAGREWEAVPASALSHETSASGPR